MRHDGANERRAETLFESGGSPRVSVITIFLNADRFLSEAIERVLTQEFQDFAAYAPYPSICCTGVASSWLPRRSYRVVLDEARDRHPELPAKVFRWSVFEAPTRYDWFRPVSGSGGCVKLTISTTYA